MVCSVSFTVAWYSLGSRASTTDPVPVVLAFATEFLAALVVAVAEFTFPAGAPQPPTNTDEIDTAIAA
jgi:hypothetical protein